MAALTVNSFADDTTSGDGFVTLREAIIAANADTITFDPIVFAVPRTIDIASQLPTVTDALTITGPDANLLTIDAGVGESKAAGDSRRLLDIDDGTGTQINRHTDQCANYRRDADRW